MATVWLILNRGSRAVSDDWEAHLVAACDARAWRVAGITDFPDKLLPLGATLEASAVDIAIVAAGDGTINTAAQVLEDWGGAMLVLPGGTMNLLAKALHATIDLDEIIAAVADPPVTRALPTVDAEANRALVGVILGPGASWVHAREAVRKGRWHRLARTLRFAYLRSLSHAVRLRRGKRRSKGYRAIFVTPEEDALSVVKISASGWSDGVRLGFGYLTGSWTTARGVELAQTPSIQLADKTPTFALFDGEPMHLPPDTVLRRGHTKLRFVTTL